MGGEQIFGQYRQELLARGGDGMIVASRFSMSTAWRARFYERTQLSERSSNLRSLYRQAVVSDRAGRGELAFDGVQPAHFFEVETFGVDVARLGPFVGDCQRVGAVLQQVRIKRRDNTRGGQLVVRPQLLAKSDLGAQQFVVAGNGGVPIKTGSGHRGSQLADKRRNRLRGALGHQHAETSAARLGESLYLGGEERFKLRPTRTRFAGDSRPRRVALVDSRLAIRIVQREGRCLGKRIRPAGAVGMFGVAIDFDRPAVVASHHQMLRAATPLDIGGEFGGCAGNITFGPLGERNDLFRLPATSLDPRQRKRRAHDLHPPTPADAFRKILRLLRKFLLHKLLKLGRVLQLVEASPVGANARFFGSDRVHQK